MLEVKNLTKKINEKILFENLNYTFENEKIISIIGKSGEGKTTFLRCIAGLCEFDKGEIILDENVIQNKESSKKENGTKDIGLIFQDFNLFPHLNVLDNLTIAPSFCEKKEKTYFYDKAFELLKLLDIDDKAKNYPFELSGGQKQRVAIARAVMLSPKVLLFDEPTSALDNESKDNVEKLFNTLKKQGLSIILVSHDMEFAKNVSDEIIRLENKKFIKEF